MNPYIVPEEDLGIDMSKLLRKFEYHDLLIFDVSDEFYEMAKPALDDIVKLVLNKSLGSSEVIMEFLQRHDLGENHKLSGLIAFFQIAAQRSYNVWVTHYETGRVRINVRP